MRQRRAAGQHLKKPQTVDPSQPHPRNITVDNANANDFTNRKPADLWIDDDCFSSTMQKDSATQANSEYNHGVDLEEIKSQWAVVQPKNIKLERKKFPSDMNNPNFIKNDQAKNTDDFDLTNLQLTGRGAGIMCNQSQIGQQAFQKIVGMVENEKPFIVPRTANGLVKR